MSLSLYHCDSNFSTAPAHPDASTSVLPIQVVPCLITKPPCHSGTLQLSPAPILRDASPEAKTSINTRLGHGLPHPSTDRASIPYVPRTRHEPTPVHTAEPVLPQPIEISGFPGPILIDSIRSSRVAPGDFFSFLSLSRANTRTHSFAAEEKRTPPVSSCARIGGKKKEEDIAFSPPLPASLIPRDPSRATQQTTPVSSHLKHSSHEPGTLLIHPAETDSRTGVTRGQDRPSPSSSAQLGRIDFFSRFPSCAIRRSGSRRNTPVAQLSNRFATPNHTLEHRLPN